MGSLGLLDGDVATSDLLVEGAPLRMGLAVPDPLGSLLRAHRDPRSFIHEFAAPTDHLLQIWTGVPRSEIDRCRP